MVSKHGKILASAIISGLALGFATWQLKIDGYPSTYLFLQVNSLVYAGWYWQLFTSLIVVAPAAIGIADVLFNAVAVLWLDRLFSGAYSPRQYYAVFVSAGLSGNLLSLLNGPDEISFGASGGIFGLLAGTVAEDYAREQRVNFTLVGWFSLIFVLSSFALPSVNWLAHLGGTLFGLFVGYALGIRRRDNPI